MKLEIKHQDSYSRLDLLLRLFFGWLYIGIPHGFLLFFVSIWAMILKIVAFFAVLIMGRYPQNIFNFHLGMLRWNLRVNARLMNLSDGYPAFGLKAQDANTEIDIPNPDKLSRLLLIVRILFGYIYVLIPHGFILFFRGIAAGVLIFLAFWAVLFTGKYPASFHSFVTGTIRWGTRVQIYMGFMTDKYPPFSGK